MCGSRQICLSGTNYDNVFFLVDEGREDPKTLIAGHYRPTRVTPIVAQHLMLLWSLVIFYGIRTSIDKEPNSFVIPQGGVGIRTLVPNPSGSGHEAVPCINHFAEENKDGCLNLIVCLMTCDCFSSIYLRVPCFGMQCVIVSLPGQTHFFGCFVYNMLVCMTVCLFICYLWHGS